MRWVVRFSICATFVSGAIAHADWPTGGIPIANGSQIQRDAFALPSANGDLRAFWVVGATSAIHAQRMRLDGTPAPGWPPGGRMVVDTPAGSSYEAAADDGSGGALIAWYEWRPQAQGIYCARMDVNGVVVPGWNPTGALASRVDSPNQTWMQNLEICRDASGGAFITWADPRFQVPPPGYDTPTPTNVYAQHLRNDGTRDPAWPDSGRAMVVGSLVGTKQNVPERLVPDGAGGFWLVCRTPSGTVLLHRDAAGDSLGTWSFAGGDPAMVEDGAGGVYLTYAGANVYVVRIGPDGPAPGWPATGVPVSSYGYGTSLTESGDGGVVVAWHEDQFEYPYGEFFRASRIDANGIILPEWTIPPTFGTTTQGLGWQCLISPDGHGGGLFAFSRIYQSIFAIAVHEDAVIPPAFPNEGLRLVPSGGGYLRAMVPDFRGGAYVIWDSPYNSVDQGDVYASHFSRNGEIGGTTGVPPYPSPPSSKIALSAPAPNPTTGAASFHLALDVAGEARVEILDLAGRTVSVVHEGALAAGRHSFTWNGRDRQGRVLPAGLYLVRANSNGSESVRRIVRVR